MFTVNGIVYAGEPGKAVDVIKVVAVRPLEGHRLWLRFSKGEEKIYDVSSLLERPAFAPLKDTAVFNQVAIEAGAPVWNNGEIDIDPECLFFKGKDAGKEPRCSTLVTSP